MYVQTGDILYKLTDIFPENAVKIKGNLIHKGNNHYHTIKGNFELYEYNNEMFILAMDICDLEHEEHNTIQLPAGLYKKGVIREYDHFLEESREVID
jgi:hypothetical protein